MKIIKFNSIFYNYNQKIKRENFNIKIIILRINMNNEIPYDINSYINEIRKIRMYESFMKDIRRWCGLYAASKYEELFSDERFNLVANEYYDSRDPTIKNNSTYEEIVIDMLDTMTEALDNNLSCSEFMNKLKH